jgi:colanic acid biosynthesis glycosyl transferase WcaI
MAAPIPLRLRTSMPTLFLSINYWPEHTGIGLFNLGRAEYLASRGHQVTVCTGLP